MGLCRGLQGVQAGSVTGVGARSPGVVVYSSGFTCSCKKSGNGAPLTGFGEVGTQVRSGAGYGQHNPIQGACNPSHIHLLCP